MIRGRAAVSVGAVFALALTVSAAEPPHGDSIDAATQQLQALKADANAAKADADAGRLPVIAIPQLHETESEPVMLPNPALDKKDKKRSKNWLVDGVMKPDPRDKHARDRLGDSVSRTGDRNPDRPLGDAADPTDPADRTDSADRTDPSEATDRRPTERDSDPGDREPKHFAATDPVFNPLSRYMGDWLAPQDAAMLRQTLNTPAASGSAAGTTAATQPAPVPGTDATLGSALAAFEVDSGTSSRRGYEPPKAADNPYLQPMALPDFAPPPAASSPSGIEAAPAPAPNNLQPPSVAPEPPKPIVPDFVKPFDDDKYYKPLKRF